MWAYRTLLLGFLVASVTALGPTRGLAQPPVGSGRLGAGAASPASPPQALDAAPAPGDGEEVDTVYFTNGGTAQGYVAEADEQRVVVVSELDRGSFTRAAFPRARVERIAYAPDAARRALAARIEWWEQKERRDAAARKGYGVAKSDKFSGAWESSGSYVAIVCDIDASATREMAFRLNEMYAQWLDLFNRKANGGPPTRMFILRNLGRYRGELIAAGVPQQAVQLSGGIYSPSLDVGLIPLQIHDRAIVAKNLEEYERRYGHLVDPNWLAHQKRAIDSALNTERALQISTAYHETMHAFMSKELFPGQEAPPVWLNEGMASYMEFIREGQHGLLVEAVNPFRYPTVRQLVAQDRLPGIRDLVVRKESIESHDTGTTASGFYAASWSLVYFLNLERDGLNTDAYARYVSALAKGVAPATAFEEMTGEPLAATEAAWKRAIPTWK